MFPVITCIFFSETDDFPYFDDHFPSFGMVVPVLKHRQYASLNREYCSWWENQPLLCLCSSSLHTACTILITSGHLYRCTDKNHDYNVMLSNIPSSPLTMWVTMTLTGCSTNDSTLVPHLLPLVKKKKKKPYLLFLRSVEWEFIHVISSWFSQPS